MNDRFTNGLIAGLIAGIGMNILDYLLFFLKYDKTLYLDFAGVLIYGKLPINILEKTLAQFAQLCFTGALGVLFAFLVIKIKSKNLLLKGTMFGISSWFAIYGVLIIFKLPSFAHINFNQAIGNFFGSIIYGLILAVVLSRLDSRNKITF